MKRLRDKAGRFIKKNPKKALALSVAAGVAAGIGLSRLIKKRK